MVRPSAQASVFATGRAFCLAIGEGVWQRHLVDWGIHLIDATRWILNETMPHTVQASGGLYYFKDQITTPDVMCAHFEFETCPVIWQHRMWGAKEYTPEIANGILLYG